VTNYNAPTDLHTMTNHVTDTWWQYYHKLYQLRSISLTLYC